MLRSFNRLVSQITLLLAFTFCTTGLLNGQTGYHVEHYTSKRGLPQNSVRGLAFDQHGFLWLATEGGIARFDGQEFVLMGKGDHPGIVNQRFTHLIQFSNTSMLFIDHLNGMYVQQNDRFSTLREPDANYTNLIRILGSLPHPGFITRDSFFLQEVTRARKTSQLTMIVLPLEDDKVLVVSDRTILLDLKKHQRKILNPGRTLRDQFARLDKILLKIDSADRLLLLSIDGKPDEPCIITNKDGTPWKGSLHNSRLFSQYPFNYLFVSDGSKLYTLSKGPGRLDFIMQPLLDALPENSSINAIAYRPSDDVLAVGTDSRGVYLYHRKNIDTYIPSVQGSLRNNAYYAQCLIDNKTILTGVGYILDLKTFNAKGSLGKRINDYLLARDIDGQLYFTRGKNLTRYDPVSKKEFIIPNAEEFTTHCITLIHDTIWIGTNLGAGQIIGDSIQCVYKNKFPNDHYGIKSICKDGQGNLWLGSYFQLYRFSPSAGQTDSFPLLQNMDIRDIQLIRNKIFIGTYGNGYFIYHDDQLIAMPKGRSLELSNTHTFIEDKDGYLWMSTNRGLYKTHMEAVEAFLKDTTIQLDYYAYLEEDGIINPEFNGGCSPTYILLPDGRYSLPSLEGLVVFDPQQTPHYFSKDSVVIEYIEVDGKRYRPEQLKSLPSNHSNIRIYFASAWWNRAANQYIYLGMEGQETLRLATTTQSSFSIGHLHSGNHTFLIKRRSGFGAEDFVYSRLRFSVEKAWYEKGWVISLFVLGIVLLTWGTSILYARSIRQRNIMLRRQVNEQTKELMMSNVQLEENVNKLAKTEIQLRKNIQVRDRLISIITHDILTPLRFIGQIARLGTEEKPTDAGLTKRALTDVQNAVHKLFHSTQNLLHWVTYHQEQFKTTTINCSPFALVEQLMEDFSEMSRFQGNVLINDVPEDDVILTDPRILTIILHNLLSNAIKYTQRGEIIIRSRIEHQWYILEVSDSGRGMTAAQLEAVRDGTTRHGEISVEDLTAGNGIGLSLVADLVQALHGRWDIDSREGNGVRVRIFITLDSAPRV